MKARRKVAREPTSKTATDCTTAPSAPNAASKDAKASQDPQFAISFGRNCRDTSPVLAYLKWKALVHRFREPQLDRGKLSLAEYQALDCGRRSEFVFFQPV